MRADTTLVALVVALIGVTAPSAAPPSDGGAAPNDLIAPAFRAERHTETAEAYLRALPDGSRIVVDRADGSHFELLLKAGTLTIDLPASRLASDGASVTTPLGYTLAFGNDARRSILVTAPSGAFTEFLPTAGSLRVTESDGGIWEFDLEGRPLRLPDGTRLDSLDKGGRWEALTLRGERFSADLDGRRWTQLDPLPSPPLVPDLLTAYLAGDGDDWRLSVWEDDTVFAWNWIAAGLPLERALSDVRQGQRRKDIEYYFQNLDRPQPAAEVGAALIGRRLALGGGDRVTFEIPGKEPVTAFILPGPIEPDYALPKGRIETALTPKTAGQ